MLDFMESLKQQAKEAGGGGGFLKIAELSEGNVGIIFPACDAHITHKHWINSKPYDCTKNSSCEHCQQADEVKIRYEFNVKTVDGEEGTLSFTRPQFRSYLYDALFRENIKDEEAMANLVFGARRAGKSFALFIKERRDGSDDIPF